MKKRLLVALLLWGLQPNFASASSPNGEWISACFNALFSTVEEINSLPEEVLEPLKNVTYKVFLEWARAGRGLPATERFEAFPQKPLEILASADGAASLSNFPTKYVLHFPLPPGGVPRWTAEQIRSAGITPEDQRTLLSRRVEELGEELMRVQVACAEVKLDLCVTFNNFLNGKSDIQLILSSPLPPPVQRRMRGEQKPAAIERRFEQTGELPRQRYRDASLAQSEEERRLLLREHNEYQWMVKEMRQARTLGTEDDFLQRFSSQPLRDLIKQTYGSK